MMNRDKFTLKANEAIERSVKLAGDYGNQEITSLHLAHAILSEPENIVPQVVKKIGIDIHGVISQIDVHLHK